MTNSKIGAWPKSFRFSAEKTFARIISSPEGNTSINIISSLSNDWRQSKNFPKLSLAEKAAWKNSNLQLWAAYTIYDHLMDGGTSLAELPAANLFLLESSKALIKRGVLADRALSLMESANQTEFLRAQNIKKDHGYWTKLRVSEIMRHGYRKSIGLYTSAFCFLENNKIREIEQEKLFDFFRHYLNCRQLADDLYDWREDLASNIPTAVTVSLMKESGARKDELSALEVLLFEKYYPRFHDFLIKNLALAKAAANDLDFLKKDNFLFSWADKAQKEELKRWQDYQKLRAEIET